MNTTYMYSLTLPFFFMVSLLLAWGGGWLISKLYSRNVLKLMQIGLAPQHASSSKPSDTSAPLSTIPFSTGSSDLQQQNRFAILRLRVLLMALVHKYTDGTTPPYPNCLKAELSLPEPKQACPNRS